jgi:threonine synthase
MTSIQYHSTRGQAPVLNFEQAVLAGLAEDGGLYLPDQLPHFSPGELTAMAALDYPALAAAVLWPFFEGEQCGVIEDKAALEALFREAYQGFHHPAIAPLVQTGPQDWVMELFHGPTLAFKDFALQFLGLLLDKLLDAKDQSVTVLGATSGDTGSAAIAGCAGCRHITTVMLHPHERVSPIQRRQMTTIHSPQVHNLAIEGSFDDCQNIVKALFTDLSFRQSRRLTAVNSINWARIIAQIVYYFHAALQLGAPARKVHFSVPTGNFGDIYAGYLAKRMGLPVGQLIIASNRNDILTRCVEKGEYRSEGVTPSLSPSMDIQISSNFERLLFDFHNRDSEKIREMMQALKNSQGFALVPAVHQQLQAEFSAERVDDATTTATIRQQYATTGMVLDPHSAVGVKVAQDHRETLQGPLVTLATAHPAKFPEAVEKAIHLRPDLPEHLQPILEKEERFTILPADPAAVKAYIDQH